MFAPRLSVNAPESQVLWGQATPSTDPWLLGGNRKSDQYATGSQRRLSPQSGIESPRKREERWRGPNIEASHCVAERER